MTPVATVTEPATATRCPGCGATAAAPAVLLRGHDRLTGAPGEFSVVGCPGCGLAFTQPRLRPEDFATYYPDSYSAYEPNTSSRPSLGERVGDLQRRAVVRFGPYREVWKRPPGRLLDVGCGVGDLAAVFAAQGWTVSGIEPSAQAAEHARAIGVDAVTGTLADAPWPEGEFDAITFNHSLEHIDDPAEAVAQAARLLKPGGLLAIAVPNFGSWHRRLFGSAWFQLDLPRHLQHFDRDSLAKLVEAQGLKVVDVGAATMRPSPLGSVQYRAFGRLRYEGRGFRLLAWALAPLLFLSDRIGEGDCLHLTAER
ncbi:MAG TPA: class I SAM-dependent methyltransferase [Solirubrobacterales bacterium]|nr:class I SAM-dependent methyltransferase [Solirubrobacterales bacterium]